MAFGISGNKAKNKSKSLSESEMRSESESLDRSRSESSTGTDVDSTSRSGAGSSMDQGYDFDSSGGASSGGDTRYGSGASFGSNMFGGPQFNQMYGNLNNMWQGFQGGGMNRINEAAGGASDFMGQAARQGMAGNQGLMGGGRMGATGSAVDPALRASLEASMSDPSQMGRMYEDIVGGAGNTYIDPMIDQMRNDESTRQGRMASGITGSAVGAGQSGSSRHGIAEGLMRSEGNRNLASSEAGARAGAYDKDLDWKMRIAQQADLGRGQAQDRAIGLLGGGDANTQYGVGQGQNMQNMGMGMMAPGMQAGMMPFQMAGMYSGAMGGPQQQQWGRENTYGQGSEYSDQNYRDAGSGYGRGGSYQDASTDYDMTSRGNASADAMSRARAEAEARANASNVSSGSSKGFGFGM